MAWGNNSHQYMYILWTIRKQKEVLRSFLVSSLIGQMRHDNVCWGGVADSKRHGTNLRSFLASRKLKVQPFTRPLGRYGKATEGMFPFLSAGAPFKAVATALVTEISAAHWSLHKARARCQRKGAVSNATMAALYLSSGGVSEISRKGNWLLKVCEFCCL